MEILNNKSKTKMADISPKKESLRRARAEGFIEISKKALQIIEKGELPKGDVLRVSETAAISAVKQTPSLLPLCHPVRITGCAVDIKIGSGGLRVEAEVSARDRTGVEMEALTSVAAALLNIYDMVKPVDKGALIREIKLVSKSGGKSGSYERKD